MVDSLMKNPRVGATLAVVPMVQCITGQGRQPSAARAIVKVAPTRFRPSRKCKKQAPRWGTCFLVARQGLVCIFAREWAKIEVRLGQALAGGAHPRRMKSFESPSMQKSEYPNGYSDFWWLARDSSAFSPLAKIMVAASSSRSCPTVHRTVGFWIFESQEIMQKAGTPLGYLLFGGSPGTRPLAPRLKRPLLYQLS